MVYKEEIKFPPVTRESNAPIFIKVVVFRRKVGRVYMDSESTCEVIYKHYFEKLNPTIKATRVNTKTTLVGFSGKHSWSVGEVLLEITIGEHPLSKTETLNFVNVKSNSPHNMLLGRTAMQKIGIVVSTIHGAIKFHTKKGVGIVLLVGEDGEEIKKNQSITTQLHDLFTTLQLHDFFTTSQLLHNFTTSLKLHDFFTTSRLHFTTLLISQLPNTTWLSKPWQSLKHPKNSSILSKPDRAYICTISGAIHRRRQIRNEDLRTELEYFSKDYDEERKMEPRPERTREVTPPLRTRSPMVRRQRERVVGFEEASNREGSRTGRNTEGSRPSKAEAKENRRREMNLPHFWHPTWEGTKMVNIYNPP
ncbi:reverse transcriptase domain-containing protein [Tanacetum coccineum]|uniref:Reverse transcriptase domain-containing protein n=1 Tax=Tanacetum coccineum TaxID=301880 RepID=A0ABQ5A769_9ASTR